MSNRIGPNRRHFMSIAGRLLALAGGLAASNAQAGDFRGTGIFKRGGAKCFLEGTRIATVDGDRAVETLRPGDMVLTSSGVAKVAWVCRQSFDLQATIPTRAFVMDAIRPVRVARHALDANSPSADLFLSPSHSLLIDGAFIPVLELVNGVSIAQVSPAEDRVAYYNLLLERHEAIYAEGALVESLLLSSEEDLLAFENGAAHLSEFRARPQVMTPAVPYRSYKGASHLTALLRRAVSPIVDVRDPVQVAYDRIASRSDRARAA